jgi:KDO2-lipid IV(A) lauroyltransferase
VTTEGACNPAATSDGTSVGNSVGNSAGSSLGTPFGSNRRCGIDTVEIARIERLLAQTPVADLNRLFSAQELADSGEGPGRAASLAARFAAKEACLKLFPRETALGQIEAHDFSVARDNYGAPLLLCAPAAAALLGRYRIRHIALSLSHDRVSASAVAVAEDDVIAVPSSGKFLYRFLPFRRDVILDNLRRVYGGRVAEDEIVHLAQAHYGHLWLLFREFLRFRWLSHQRKMALVRIENVEAFAAALAQEKGVLLLTGHFGNWEVSTIAGLNHYPQMRGRFHFVRRAIKPVWLDRLVTRRFNAAGFGVFPKRGSLDAMLDALAAGDAIVFPFDQHARPPDGIEVEFFGAPAWTFKSLAIIALATGAPVLPACSWRESDGRHVLRFEEPMTPIECENTNEAIRLNTRAYNAVLERIILRRPEQWYWVHRRWKTAALRARPGKGRP